MDDVDPEALALLRIRARQQIRQRLRSLRAAHPARARAARSRTICDRLLELESYSNARRIALYAADKKRGEVELDAVDADARSAGKEVYYPYLTTDGEPRAGFRRVEDPASLGERGHHFAEPPEDAPEAGIDALDLIVVPCVAVAEDGHRLGYGSGFYDRVLPRFCPPAKSVVVAYEFQMVAEVRREKPT